MTERMRALAALGAVVLLALGGIAFDATTTDVAAPQPGAPEPGFVQRAAFCPPPVRGTEGVTRLAAATSGGGAVAVSVEPDGAPEELGAERLLSLVPRDSATSVTGIGARLVASVASSIAEPLRGAAASRCSGVAATTWYFPEGSSALGADGRLLLYNPFQDEAVARVLFYTPLGVEAKANLADVAVPAGASVEVAVNEFVLRRPLLSAAVIVTRGRVVAWAELFRAGERQRGAEMTLGAASASDIWYFPAGAVGEGYAERITLLNPSAEEASVTITLATETRVLQPPRLVELTLPPESSRAVALDELVQPPRQPQSVSAWVTSTTGVPIVAERTLRLVGAGRRGLSSEIGVTGAARRWLLGPAVLQPATDAVHVMNPGTQDASVTLTLIRPDAPSLAPRALADIEVPAGLRVTVRLDRWTRGETVGAVLVSDREVMAERTARSAPGADIAALMGTAVRPSAP
ncbi:hypothetical protein BH24ACT26_BH24ACT26_07540 [soil metagenome]